MASQRHQAHLSHCLHILLQALTCQPSLDVISHVWMRTQQNAYPDFNIQRQCVAHDGILEWQREHSIMEHVIEHNGVPRPETFVELEPEPGVLLIGEDLGNRIDHAHEPEHEHEH